MNVVVLVAHGLNCHWLGPYGNTWVSTPAFDALACEAVVFDRHFADDPSPAGFRAGCPAAVLRALKGVGVTSVFVDDHKPGAGDDRDWDHVIRPAPAGDAPPGEPFLSGVGAALDRLSAASRWLLWVETDRLIPPWDFHFDAYQQYAADTGEFGEDDESNDKPGEAPPIDEPAPGPIAEDDDSIWHRLRNSFAAAVTALDAELDALTKLLRTRGLDQSAAWVVTSGYGWPLGEHGIVGPDGSRMHEELVHLPLLIRLPGGREAMRRVPAFSQASDLGPTLLDLFGVALPPGIAGVSVLALTAGSVSATRETARSARGDERAIRTDEWAYLPPAADRPECLYRKPDDVWEVNDLAPRHPDECERLAAVLDGRPTEVATP